MFCILLHLSPLLVSCPLFAKAEPATRFIKGKGYFRNNTTLELDAGKAIESGDVENCPSVFCNHIRIRIRNRKRK